MHVCMGVCKCYLVAAPRSTMARYAIHRTDHRYCLVVLWLKFKVPIVGGLAGWRVGGFDNGSRAVLLVCFFFICSCNGIEFFLLPLHGAAAAPQTRFPFTVSSRSAVGIASPTIP